MRALAILLALFSQLALAGWPEEKAKIDQLLQKISEQKGAKFIRNGEPHPASKATEHLKMKLENAQKMFWTPKKSEWTAEMFIEKIATKSSLSGKLYQIRFSDGRTVNSGDWLRTQLNSIDK